jgi:ribosomal protein S18 acetylase RimI-like enzyme
MSEKSYIEYTEADRQDLETIRGLWQELIAHHQALAPDYFASHYARMTFDLRKKDLLEKSGKGALRIDLARERATGELVGYCVSTISEHGQGEIDSIYVVQDYRRSGIGDTLMRQALGWMDECSVTKKVLAVGAGNEEVFAYYRRYGFYPRVTILEQVDNQVP